MTAWPGTLPSMPLSSVTDTLQESRVSSPMDAGPPAVRNRYTAVPRHVKFPLVLTGTERTAFDTFYQTTLNYGTDQFDWIDPVDDTTVTMRFLKPPEWAVVRGGAASTRLWQATLELEILP